MQETDSKILSHFELVRFKDPYYGLAYSDRQAFHSDLYTQLRASATAVNLYQVYPTEACTDLLIWSSLRVDQPEAAARYFGSHAKAISPHRHLLEPQHSFWGFSRPSQYTKVPSAQEIDPFTGERKRYLILYPFVKTPEWYLLSQEARQGMMNGHIKTCKQYPQIQQLLLYSFGLQDQEFVVVYEADDLSEFSDLVYALRNTDARRYTLRDTPVFTAVYLSAQAVLQLWE